MRIVFDQGTIVLLGTPARPWDHLPGAWWDPQISAFRFPARFHGPLLRELNRRHVAFTDEVASPLDTWTGPTPSIDLQPYQEAALVAWNLSERRGFAVLPTGTGKTRIAIAAIARLGLPTLCLVPTRALLDQWARTILELLHRHPGRLGNGSHEIRSMTVATYESGWRHMPQIGNRFSLLIVDEAHHFGSSMHDQALDQCTAPCRLGFAATPPRGQAMERLSQLLGPMIYELH